MTRLALTLCCLAACFGTGPVPSLPSDATILLRFDLPPKSDNCRTTRYIHQVAIGPDAGYAVTSTFLPACNDGSTGNSGEALPVSVLQFDKRGGNAGGVMVGAAGMLAEGSAKPRLAALAGDVVWAFAPQMDNRVHVASKSSGISATIQPGNSANTPYGVVSDDTTTYIATGTNFPINVDPNHPRFPCCSSSSQGPPLQFGFFRLPNAAGAGATAMPVAPPLRCEQTKDCVVANSSTLFYLERVQPPLVAGVSLLRKNATTPEPVGMMAEPPTALAADETHVAWATSIDFTEFGSSPNVEAPNACNIYVSTISAPHQTRLLLATGQFSCMDVALDGNHVYFTIVRLATGAFDATVTGLGIGRIALVTAAEAGPRHLFIDGDDVITVAPFIVTSYRKSIVEGREDFHL